MLLDHELYTSGGPTDEKLAPLERRIQSLKDRHLNYEGSERGNAAKKQTKSRGKSPNPNQKKSQNKKKGGKGGKG